MKHLARLIAAIAIIAAAAAPARAEFRWGPTAGAAFTTLNFKQDLFEVNNAIGPMAGVMGELMFPGIGFGVDFGAMYTMQGATLNLGQRELWRADGFGKERAMLHTLSIPLDVRFKWTRMNGIEDWIAPYVFGGPVFDFTVAHSGISSDIKGTPDPMQYAAGAISLQCGFGLELLKRWQVQFSHVWGMTYMLKARKLTDFSARERYWTLRLAYLF